MVNSFLKMYYTAAIMGFSEPSPRTGNPAEPGWLCLARKGLEVDNKRGWGKGTDARWDHDAVLFLQCHT